MKNIATCLLALFWSYIAVAATSYPLTSDPVITSIEAKDNHERLYDLRKQDIICYGPSPEIEDNQDYTKLRKTVYDMLVKAQSSLPNNLRLCVYEAYRPLELQESLFNNQYNSYKRRNPTWSHEKLFNATRVIVSPVTNLDGTKNLPPHATGGAIAVYLVDENEELIDMGLAVKDWRRDLDYELSPTYSIKISNSAKNYRAIMSKALSDAGFVNYPGQYWHWSYGDKYWAHAKKHYYAIYDQAREK
jgi:D-alanyl-D-alanine dipeptidase